MPVCPLCNIPIPVKRGEPPDIKVGQHIDTDCQSDPAKEKRKVSKNSLFVKIWFVQQEVARKWHLLN